MNPLTRLHVRLINGLYRLARDNRAVTLIEYAILLGVVVAAVAVAANQFGDQIQAAITQISTNVTGVTSTIGQT